MTWVNVPAAILLVLMLCLYTRRSVEIAIPLAISLAMPVLLVLAAARGLSYVDWFSAVFLAVTGAWLVREIHGGRVTRTAVCAFFKKQVFTPGLACFALLGVFWTLANQDRAVLNYDEYNYWATQVRSLYVSGGLVNGARTCCMEHAAYPPGMQLMEWWFMHLRGQWHEGTLYTSAFWLNSAFLLPLARRITWRQWWMTGLFVAGVIALPTVLTGHAYSMLATDTTLGVIFGALLCVLWSEGRAPYAPLAAGALMTALVLSKQTGILWAVAGMAFLLMTRGRKTLRNRRWLLACAAPVAMLALWQAFCRMEGLGSMHIERMFSATPAWNEVLWAWEWIVKTLFIRPLNRSGGWDGMLPLAGIPAVLWVALFCAVILLRVKGPLRGRCVTFTAGSFALYAPIVMASAATVFAPEIPRWQAHPERLTEVVDRYFIPYFYAMASWMALLMEGASLSKARPVRGLIAACACLGLALTVNWQNLACFLPGGFAARFPTDNGSVWLRENLSWYTRIETPDDARVLVAPGTVSSMRYALVPVSLVATGGLWEDGDTAEMLLALADEVSATHLVATDPQSAQTLGEALGQKVLTDTLYLIDRAQSAGLLVEVLPREDRRGIEVSMKQQKLRFRVLAFVVIGLLALAGVYGVYSVSTYGSRWISSTRNTRYRSAKSSVIPGDIIDRRGVVVATTDENGERVYQSNILSRSSMVHLLGDDEGNIANGVESFQANYLLGFETSLTERVTAFFNGETRRGDNVTITADSRLCTEIVNIFRNTSNLKGKCGAVVVMNYKTGEVLALVSLPVYDPQNITDQIRNSSQHPFWNRALQGTLPPGSTFKIITAAAALENLPDAETHVFTCTGATQVMDHVVHDYNMDQHGDITLDKAFRVSCNNVFAQAALMMGDTALRRMAESFGFNDNFLFRDLVVENSVYPTENRNSFEIAWSGAGQSQVVATPMHMCMVAAAIANDGVMMEPRLLSLVESPSGNVRLRYSQKVYRTACSPELAEIIDGYMKDVVKSGTGTRAQVSGLTIAGKTGSAEGSDNGVDVTHAWFVGYIDSDEYPYAISVLVENGGSGGSVAAPVARQVFEYLRDNLPS